VNDIFPHTFHILHPSLCGDVHRKLFRGWDFHENMCSASGTLLPGVNEFLFLLSKIYYPVWLEFGNRALHKILLSIFDFCRNRLRECRTFIMSVYEITFMSYTMKPYDMLKAKEKKTPNTFLVNFKNNCRAFCDVPPCSLVVLNQLWEKISCLCFISRWKQYVPPKLQNISTRLHGGKTSRIQYSKQSPP